MTVSALVQRGLPDAEMASSRLRPADVVRLAGFGLRARRLRSVLSALGICIGIAAIVGVLGLASSSQADLNAQLDRLGTNLLTVKPGQQLGGAPSELPLAARSMVGRVGPVSQVSQTGVVVNATVRRSDHVSAVSTGGLVVQAASADLLATLNGSMVSGAFLNPATEHYPSVVLGNGAAKTLGIASVTPATRVWIANHWFDVAGIMAPTTIAPEIDRSALVGFSIAQSELNFDTHPTTLYLRADPNQVTAVQGVLGRTANPEHPEEVVVSRPSDALAAQQAAQSSYTSLFVGLGGVALLVGGVGIGNVMVISVIERRAEIGLRRALGAAKRHIALQFLTESVFLSLLGGLAGTLLGVLVTIAYAHIRGWTFAMPLYVPFAGAGAAVLIGATAGLYPALRAARLAPTEALRVG
jgi:putative ABC transport system permease protein